MARIESGELTRVTIRSLEALVTAVGGSLDVSIRWHGEGLDRLLDAAHAALVEQVVRRLRDAGWETAVEVSFNLAGERGSVDVMGLDRGRAAVLVVEVKSVVPDAGPMLFTLDRKARLAPEIARTLGWPCEVVGRLLVIGDSSTTRRRVAAVTTTFATVLPVRGVAVRRWLANPVGPMAGILFVPFATGSGRSQRVTGRQRVRPRVKSVTQARKRTSRSRTPPVVASGEGREPDRG